MYANRNGMVNTARASRAQRKANVTIQTEGNSQNHPGFYKEANRSRSQTLGSHGWARLIRRHNCSCDSPLLIFWTPAMNTLAAF